MKMRILGISLLLAGAVSLQAQEAAPAPAAPAAAAPAEVRGDVVSSDAEARTLKLKTGEGEAVAEWTLAVEGDAVQALSELEAGQSVVVGCREGTSGDGCVAVTVTVHKPEAKE